MFTPVKWESGVQNSAGKCLVHAFEYRIVLGVTWCKLFKILSNIGK